MRSPRIPLIVGILALMIAVGLAPRAGPVTAESVFAPPVSGVPGPTARGSRVDPRTLPHLSPITSSGTPRAIPARYPVDQATFDRLKQAANTSAASRVRARTTGGLAAVSAAPTSSSLRSFATLDLNDTGGWNPPDGGLAVGPTTVLVALNEAYAFYDRSNGARVSAPIGFDSLYNTTANPFDPRALYDSGRGRFILLTAASDSTSQTASYDLAVSQNSHAGTSWCTYQIDARTYSGGSTDWADYPGLGMDGDNLYITSNQFAFGGGFTQARLLVIPKSTVYPDIQSGACGIATSTDFQYLTNPDGSLAFTVQPANEPDALPCSNDTLYLVNAIWSSGSALAVREISFSAGMPVLGPPSWVIVASYDLPADAIESGGQSITTGDDRLLDAIYRFGTIYTAHTTRDSSLGAANPYASAQWYAITPTGVGFSATSHLVSDSTVSYFYPGVVPGACSGCSGAFVGLEVSGAGSTAPASAYAATLFPGSGYAALPVVFQAGVGGYTAGGRWGDYPGIAADPNDPGTVWALGEYAWQTNAWGTAAVAMSATGPATATVTPVGTPTGVGFGMDVAAVRDDFAPSTSGCALQLTRNAGFDWVLVQIKWSAIEPSRGVYDWSTLDDVLTQVGRYGLKPVLRLDSAPSWANGSTDPTAPPISPADFGDFTAALVGHAGNRAAGYVIWNEPNLAAEWGGQAPDAAGYAALLQQAYARAKAVNPAAIIVSAPLAPTANRDATALDDRLYLAQLYADGLRATSDVIGMNALGFASAPDDTSNPNQLYFSRVSQLHDVMVQNGDGTKQAWAIEMGWLRDATVDLGSYDWMEVPESIRAQYLVQAYQIAANEWPWMGVMFVWNLDDARHLPVSDQKGWFGVLDASGTPLPSYNALAAMPKPPSTYTPTPSPTSTPQPPTVQWLAPISNGGVYSASGGIVQLQVSATASAGISDVNFNRWDAVTSQYVAIQTVYSPPYVASLDVGALNPGWNQIDADATANDGGRTRASIWIYRTTPSSTATPTNTATPTATSNSTDTPRPTGTPTPASYAVYLPAIANGSSPP